MKMKEEYKTPIGMKVAIIFLGAILMGIIILVFVLSSPYLNKEKSGRIGDRTIYNLSYIIETCDDLDIEDTAYCMNQILRQVPMNMSNYRRFIDEDRFFREGGVCRHFSNMYRKAAQEFGFRTKTMILHNSVPHEFIVIYDADTYIVLDQHIMYVTHMGEPEDERY